MFRRIAGLPLLVPAKLRRRAGAALLSTSQYCGVNPKGGALLSDRHFEELSSSRGTGGGLDGVMRAAKESHDVYKRASSDEIAGYLRCLAGEVNGLGEELVERCSLESGYPEERVRAERTRTTEQLEKFAALVEEGSWKQSFLNPSASGGTSVDIRRTLIPLGPVVVFGATNFPLAFGVLGGDTASALAAGNSVVCKANRAHPGTCALVHEAAVAAAKACGMPEAVVQLVHGPGGEEGAEVMRALVTHDDCAAVGFTGSYRGGRYLHDLCAARRRPIPVYAEMGSNNPVLIMPSAMSTRWENIANGLAGSITLGVGQFCTNPGLVLVCGDNTPRFIDALERAVRNSPPGTMLTSGMLEGYEQARDGLAATPGIRRLSPERDNGNREWNEAGGEIFHTTAQNFLQNPDACSEEVFGPTSLLVECESVDEMRAVAASLGGQLTATVWGDEADLVGEEGERLLWTLQERAGRVLFNGFPTGVEVCASMNHGGPWPASTSPFHTSVGSEAIKRFARPVCLQNFPDAALPPELRDDNPHAIWRVQDNLELTKTAIAPHPRG